MSKHFFSFSSRTSPKPGAVPFCSPLPRLPPPVGSLQQLLWLCSPSARRDRGSRGPLGVLWKAQPQRLWEEGGTTSLPPSAALAGIYFSSPAILKRSNERLGDPDHPRPGFSPVPNLPPPPPPPPPLLLLSLEGGSVGLTPGQEMIPAREVEWG
uniref:Uncharacterized protein n=1 Tax=Myotis myotis TaxID=51298 RepID=A0A7J7YEM2_MYOMY|nr:hypothetical protein mMyoMyo1_011034 [Myotis myotis]